MNCIVIMRGGSIVTVVATEAEAEAYVIENQDHRFCLWRVRDGKPAGSLLPAEPFFPLLWS